MFYELHSYFAVLLVNSTNSLTTPSVSYPGISNSYTLTHGSHSVVLKSKCCGQMLLAQWQDKICEMLLWALIFHVLYTSMKWANPEVYREIPWTRPQNSVSLMLWDISNRQREGNNYQRFKTPEFCPQWALGIDSLEHFSFFLEYCSHLLHSYCYCLEMASFKSTEVPLSKPRYLEWNSVSPGKY